MMIINFSDIAEAAGFVSVNGKFDLPATQETSDKLSASALSLLPKWNPGDEGLNVVLTGAGPVWGYLSIAHSLHGIVKQLSYTAPNTPSITIFKHG